MLRHRSIGGNFIFPQIARFLVNEIVLRLNKQPMDVLRFSLAVFDAVSYSALFLCNDKGGPEFLLRVEDDLSWLGKLVDEELQHVL